MEVSTHEPYFGQCKCCHKETYLKNMWYTSRGQDEIFGQMLVDCFAINWMIQGSLEDDKICEVCIAKLRAAVSFKNQVIESQAGFLQDNNANVSEEDIVEEEIDDKFDLNGDTRAYENVEFLDEEVLEEAYKDDDSQDSEPLEKKPKWPKKLPPSERYKSYRQYTDDNLKEAVEQVREKKMSLTKASDTYKIPKKSISKKLYDDTDGGRAIDQSAEEDLDTTLLKHKDNIRSVLAASNATPIRGHWGFGYTCYFCPKQFAKPSELKQHTFTHGSLIPGIKVRSLTDHIVKLDVTDLRCNICEEDFQSLDYLMIHLKDRHEMSMHLNIPNHIVPFNFQSDVLKCVKCPQRFDSFKDLSEHMNDAHFRNYECVACKQGFVNIRTLKTHSIAHGLNVFACSFCLRVFYSKTEVFEHEKLHSKITETKMDIKAKMPKNAVVKIEPSNETIHKCRSCPKIFESRSDLLYHVNSVHKPHKCGVCNRTFDFQFSLKKHVLREHASRTYDCTKCSKKFVMEQHLKSHMAEHTDSVEKFCCEVCCRQFNKEENYMLHMKNKHGLE